nr:hypothetical protein CFP56_57849 [Quercus suber]
MEVGQVPYVQFRMYSTVPAFPVQPVAPPPAITSNQCSSGQGPAFDGASGGRKIIHDNSILQVQSLNLDGALEMNRSVDSCTVNVDSKVGRI